MTRNSGRGGAQVDLGARLSWSVGFGGPRRRGPQGPQVRIVRGDNADPLGGMGGGPTAEQALQPRALRAGVQPAEPHQRAELQRRDDVAVLRAGDVGGRAAARRDRHAVLVLRSVRLRGRRPQSWSQALRRPWSAFTQTYIIAYNAMPDGDGEVQRIDVVADRDAHAMSAAASTAGVRPAPSVPTTSASRAGRGA